VVLEPPSKELGPLDGDDHSQVGVRPLTADEGVGAALEVGPRNLTQ
jgi:hypothetical protein